MKNVTLKILKILKIIGVIFCGLTTLAGIINTISPSTNDFRVENVMLTAIFLALTILLVRSIRKGGAIRQPLLRRSANISGKPAYTYRESGSAALSAPATDLARICVDQPEQAVSAPIIDRSTPLALFNCIPSEIFDLLWFLNGPFQNYTQNPVDWDLGYTGEFIHIKSVYACEPSAIDVDLPLSPEPALPDPLNYYPSYEALTPQQRTSYLNWLVDITAPIDIGYVFIFYYGLERHLFFGNSDAALATILILRAFHKNRSFQAYSGDAILLYALVHNKPEVLQHLSAQQLSPDLRLFASVVVCHCLTAQDIMVAHKKFSFENTRYIKSAPDLFLSTLEDLLFEETGIREFEVTPNDFQSAGGTFTLALANYSLLPAQRFLPLPDISTAPRVHDSIYSLLIKTHESVKVKLRELRKQSKNM